MNNELGGLCTISPLHAQQVTKYADAFLSAYTLTPSIELISKYLTIYLLLTEAKLLLHQQPLFVQSLHKQLNYDERDVKLITLLQQRKKLHLFPPICLQIAKIMVRRNNQMLFAVSSSRQLTASEKQVVIGFLERKVPQAPLVFFAQNPNLISGISIKADCFLYEKSIKSRINQVLLTLKAMSL